MVISLIPLQRFSCAPSSYARLHLFSSLFPAHRSICRLCLQTVTITYCYIQLHTVLQQLHFFLLRPGSSDSVNVSLIVEGTNDVLADDLQQEKLENATRKGARTKEKIPSN